MCIPAQLDDTDITIGLGLSAGMKALEEIATDKRIIALPGGLDKFCIEYIHEVETGIDKALSPLGWSRVGTEKGDRIVLKYQQFGWPIA